MAFIYFPNGPKFCTREPRRNMAHYIHFLLESPEEKNEKALRNGNVSTSHFPGIVASTNSSDVFLATFTSGSSAPSRDVAGTSYP